MVSGFTSRMAMIVAATLVFPGTGWFAGKKGLIALVRRLAPTVPLLLLWTSSFREHSIRRGWRTVGQRIVAWNGCLCLQRPIRLPGATQWLHGVNPEHGITWRMNVQLRSGREKEGPQPLRDRRWPGRRTAQVIRQPAEANLARELEVDWPQISPRWLPFAPGRTCRLCPAPAGLLETRCHHSERNQ